MKARVLALLLVGLLLGLASTIPDGSSTAYPPPPGPGFVEPMFFGVYCDYPGTIPPNEGYMRIKWDENFPVGYEMDTVDPGAVTVFYPSIGYRHYGLLIVENDVSHWWGTTWNSPEQELAEITAYVRIRPIGGGPAINVGVSPSPWLQFCPEPFNYIPQVMR